MRSFETRLPAEQTRITAQLAVRLSTEHSVSFRDDREAEHEKNSNMRLHTATPTWRTAQWFGASTRCAVAGFGVRAPLVSPF